MSQQCIPTTAGIGIDFILYACRLIVQFLWLEVWIDQQKCCVRGILANCFLPILHSFKIWCCFCDEYWDSIVWHRDRLFAMGKQESTHQMVQVEVEKCWKQALTQNKNHGRFEYSVTLLCLYRGIACLLKVSITKYYGILMIGWLTRWSIDVTSRADYISSNFQTVKKICKIPIHV